MWAALNGVRSIYCVYLSPNYMVQFGQEITENSNPNYKVVSTGGFSIDWLCFCCVPCRMASKCIRHWTQIRTTWLCRSSCCSCQLLCWKFPLRLFLVWRRKTTFFFYCLVVHPSFPYLLIHFSFLFFHFRRALGVVWTTPLVAALGASLTIPLAMLEDMVIHGRHYSIIYILGSVQVIRRLKAEFLLRIFFK